MKYVRKKLNKYVKLVLNKLKDTSKKQKGHLKTIHNFMKLFSPNIYAYRKCSLIP